MTKMDRTRKAHPIQADQRERRPVGYALTAFARHFLVEKYSTAGGHGGTVQIAVRPIMPACASDKLTSGIIDCSGLADLTETYLVA